MLPIQEAIQISWEIHALHKQCIARLLSNQNIHFGQPPLLFSLKKHGGTCNQKELARMLNVSPAAVAVSLKRMEKAGLVHRIQDPSDLRSNHVELTEAGLCAANRAQATLRKTMEMALSDFCEEDLCRFLELSRQMRDNLNRYKNKLNIQEEFT